jgi:hypothetical protein
MLAQHTAVTAVLLEYGAQDAITRTALEPAPHTPAQNQLPVCMSVHAAADGLVLPSTKKFAASGSCF